MYFVYILFSEKLNKRYVGSTSDVQQRLLEHNSGHSKFTKGSIPWKVIYVEEYKTISEARKRELFLKSGEGEDFWTICSNEISKIGIEGSAPKAHLGQRRMSLRRRIPPSPPVPTFLSLKI